MWRRDGFVPIRMRRVALMAPATSTRAMLEHVGDAGVVELEPREVDDIREAELDHRVEQVITRDSVSGIVGWTPEPALRKLAEDLAPTGAAVVPLDPPKGVQPPTLLSQNKRGRSFDLLVETYATVPYTNVDPTFLAGLVYAAMFGMMFGDVGHGLLLLFGALLVRSGRPRLLAGARRAWPILAGGGTFAVLFGLLYGEFFGPTGVIPVLWLSPMEDTVTLLIAALGVGALLLAGAYTLGTINRVREGGWGFALYARTGFAGSALFLAAAVIVGGVYFAAPAMTAIGIVVGCLGLALTFVGLLIISGSGASNVLQAIVELFDTVVRLISNVASFARLAAFGLVHAAVGAVVWNGTVALWGPDAGGIAAVALFVVGNLVAFSFEALVAGIQALRLEYYELFSRVFDVEGRPFHPWRLPPRTEEVAT